MALASIIAEAWLSEYSFVWRRIVVLIARFDNLLQAIDFKLLLLSHFGKLLSRVERLQKCFVTLTILSLDGIYLAFVLLISQLVG